VQGIDALAETEPGVRSLQEHAAAMLRMRLEQSPDSEGMMP